MKRTVEPEWLDDLPALDRAAISSRRDIGRLNRIMGHSATMRELLETSLSRPAPKRIVELGAGDGRFMLKLARHFSSAWPHVEMILVDSKNAVTPETRNDFATLGWRLEIAEADVFDWLSDPTPHADIMLANLFLHQFAAAPLTRLLALAVQKTNLFVACEPRRAAMPLAFSRMVGFIGCNAVTRHDAPISVRAGFDGYELSAMWQVNGRPDWRLCEDNANIFTHTFLAERASSQTGP